MYKQPESSVRSIKNILCIEEENQLISPTSRWNSQPKSYRGAKSATRDCSGIRKFIRKMPTFSDTTDGEGETSGMGSSVEEPIESSTESASETFNPGFLQPRSSVRAQSISPSSVKKKRGGWPKGRKRKPEFQGTKPPKAPLTAYVLFLNERRKYYKENHSHLPFIEVSKLMGSEWSSMSVDQKAAYVTKSEQEKKRYRNELQSYRQSHDYQLQLRKKRMKNAVRRGATTTEESSDFTDEIDDDDSEELYCRTCDQWFISLHNKREHLYGRLHLKAVTGEYQRERKAEEFRQKVTALIHSEASCSSDMPGVEVSRYDPEDNMCALNSPAQLTKVLLSEESTESDQSKFNKEKTWALTHLESTILQDEKVEKRRWTVRASRNQYKTRKLDQTGSDEFMYSSSGPSYDSTSGGETVAETFFSATEDDCDDEEYDGEEEVTEEEGDSDRVTDAAEEVLYRVVARENEMQWLRRRQEKARNSHKKLTASLLGLLNKQEELEKQQIKIIAEEKVIKEKIDNFVQFINYWKNQDKNFTEHKGIGKYVNYSDNNHILENDKIIPVRLKNGFVTNLKKSETSIPWRLQDDMNSENKLSNLTETSEIKLVPKPLRLKTKFVKLKNLPNKEKREDLKLSLYKLPIQESKLPIQESTLPIQETVIDKSVLVSKSLNSINFFHHGDIPKDNKEYKLKRDVNLFEQDIDVEEKRSNSKESNQSIISSFKLSSGIDKKKDNSKNYRNDNISHSERKSNENSQFSPLLYKDLRLATSSIDSQFSPLLYKDLRLATSSIDSQFSPLLYKDLRLATSSIDSQFSPLLYKDLRLATSSSEDLSSHEFSSCDNRLLSNYFVENEEDTKGVNPNAEINYSGLNDTLDSGGKDDKLFLFKKSIYQNSLKISHLTDSVVNNDINSYVPSGSLLNEASTSYVKLTLADDISKLHSSYDDCSSNLSVSNSQTEDISQDYINVAHLIGPEESIPPIICEETFFKQFDFDFEKLDSEGFEKLNENDVLDPPLSDIFNENEIVSILENGR